MSRAAFPSNAKSPPARSARDDVAVQSENGLAEVSAALSLPRLRRLLRARGVVLPFARPLPPLLVHEACARLPFFLDSFVASADLVTTSGARCGTPRAPRSATGPDLLGALCTSPPLAVAERVRLRVLDTRLARVQVRTCSSAASAAAALCELLEVGRAFSASAAREGEGVFRVLALGGPAAFEAEGEPAAAFAHRARLRVRSATSLVPGDERAMVAALEAGARVVAAPAMGRAGVLSPAKAPASSSAAGALAFAAALTGRRTHG
jgi:hypothetical protein